jgi:large subunit ribosomal protein L32
MANPTHRHTRTRRDKRRANWKSNIETPNVVLCPDCQEPTISHRVCPSCGSYKGKKIIEVVEKEVV